MTSLIDYDAGNLKSVEKALLYLGEDVQITRNPEKLMHSDRVILPGVGSFGDAMEKLSRYELIPVIREVAANGIPFFGICLGLQLLFEESDEAPGVRGLGLLPGRIRRFPKESGLKIPQIGWNSLTLRHEGRLFRDIPDGSFVYFVHSYYLECSPEDPRVKAFCDYGVSFGASVEQENVFACQFHPEKSSVTGLKILKNFLSVS